MSQKFQTLDELMREEEDRILAESKTPEAEAAWAKQLDRIAARRKAEHDRHVALGWIDEDGNSLLPPDEDDEDEDEEEETE